MMMAVDRLESFPLAASPEFRPAETFTNDPEYVEDGVVA